LKKIYFVGVASEHPHRMRMDDVFVFSPEQRMLARAPVTRAPNVKDPVLRIRLGRGGGGGAPG
jgi:hypothetical protein